MDQSHQCTNCSGCSNCGGCDGCCANQLTLTQREIQMLETFARIPFLPVARKMGDLSPIYLEQDDYSVEEYSLLLQCLEKKNLISLDYDLPLKNFDDSAYAGYPIRGSMALTQRGQQVLDLIQTQGVSE